MPLQIITTAPGVTKVTYTPPHPASINNSIAVPKFNEVEAAYEVLRTGNVGGSEWGEAMDTIERFIYTR